MKITFVQNEKMQFPDVTEGVQNVFVKYLRRVDTEFRIEDHLVLKCDPSFGVEESQRQDQLQVTPNPSKNLIVISSATQKFSGGERVRIYNRNGGIVFNGILPKDVLTVNVQNYVEDLYIIHVITKDGVNMYGRFKKE